MSKSIKKPSVSRVLQKRVFGQGETKPRAGLYARVSTHDQQTLPMQLAAMRDYVWKRGWVIAVEVKDIGSGATVRQKREELLMAARKRDIDLVVVWRLDRWGRSLVDLVNTLQELSSLKVGFFSLSEALDMTTPSGRALAGMLAVFAEVRARHSAGPCQGRNCAGSKRRKASRQTAFRRATSSEDSRTLREWDLKTGDS
jgi:putative DNA-invertase from lambdoid prophage Rac